jgi:formylmethanofuran dehydrogenase subunit C
LSEGEKNERVNEGNKSLEIGNIIENGNVTIQNEAKKFCCKEQYGISTFIHLYA